MFKKKHGDKVNASDDLELVVLRTINNNYELEMIKNLLDEHEIPYIIKDHGIGGYMRVISGDSLYRTDILVEKSLFEKARDILDQIAWQE